MSDQDKHPAPWAWVWDSGAGYASTGTSDRLVAANGAVVMESSTANDPEAITSGEIVIANTYVTELIRRAPDLEAFLCEIIDGRVPSMDPAGDVLTVFVNAGRFGALTALLAELAALRKADQ